MRCPHIARSALQVLFTSSGHASPPTNTLYKYAETHSILSTTQAGFRKHDNTVHQLQNVIMALEDAKLFCKDIYALIIDSTSALNTNDHSRMLWIMYDLGFPTDAIDAVRISMNMPPLK